MKQLENCTPTHIFQAASTEASRGFYVGDLLWEIQGVLCLLTKKHQLIHPRVRTSIDTTTLYPRCSHTFELDAPQTAVSTRFYYTFGWLISPHRVGHLVDFIAPYAGCEARGLFYCVLQ